GAGIRDDLVTGVQTCALPISLSRALRAVGQVLGGYARSSQDLETTACEWAGFGLAATPRLLHGAERARQRQRRATVVALQVSVEIGRASCRDRGWGVGGERHV